MDSGVVLFKVYKLWDTLDRFGLHGIHTFKMNRSGPWRLGKHEKINLRVSKLISRDLYQFWPPKTHFKRSTESENTRSMFPEPSYSKTMCVWIDRDTVLPHLYILTNPLHVELKTYIHFSFKKYTLQAGLLLHSSVNIFTLFRGFHFYSWPWF